MKNSIKQRRRQFTANVEHMERREVLSGATLMMYPGSDHQAIFKYTTGQPIAEVTAGFSSTAFDINNQPINWNGDGLPDLLNISQRLVKNGGNYSSGGFDLNPVITTGAGFKLTNLNGNGFTGGAAGAALDWNGDGYTDFISLNASYDNPSGFNYSIFQNNGQGVFTSVISTKLITNETSLDAAGSFLLMKDFNNDGAPDMLVPSGFSTNYYLFNGVLEGGKWNGRFDDVNFQKLTGAFVLYDANPQAADLNGDGKLDIITPGTNGAGVFINDGSGHFTTNPSLTLP